MTNVVVDKPLDDDLVALCAAASLNAAITVAKIEGGDPSEIMHALLIAYVMVAMQVTGAKRSCELAPQLREVFKDFVDDVESGKADINYEVEEDANALN